LIHLDFILQEVHPADLKAAVAKSINRLLAPIRERWAASKELKDLTQSAYPDMSKIGKIHVLPKIFFELITEITGK